MHRETPPRRLRKRVRRLADRIVDPSERLVNFTKNSCICGIATGTKSVAEKEEKRLRRKANRKQSRKQKSRRAAGP